MQYEDPWMIVGGPQTVVVVALVVVGVAVLAAEEADGVKAEAVVAIAVAEVFVTARDGVPTGQLESAISPFASSFRIQRSPAPAPYE
jgi:hypothetical protein